MDDFNTKVLTCTDDFWGISSGLKDILIAINENPKVQSLYSHKETSDEWIPKPSYIVLAFTQDIELTIFREIIPYFQTCFNADNDCRFNYLYSYPIVKDKVKETNGANDLASLTDKEYWRINNIRFELTSNAKDINDKFWRDIQTKLSELT